jgi:hypothetical protein
MDPKTGLRIEPTPEEEALKKMQRERDAPFKVIVSRPPSVVWDEASKREWKGGTEC